MANHRKLFAAAFVILTFTAFANTPVVFLHGWRGSASGWNTMTNLLVQNGGYEAKDLYPVDYWVSATTPIQTYARRVNSDITVWLYKNGFYNDRTPVIDIVAHSMGGLVVREIVANNLNQGSYGIRRVITLATPHYGQNQEAGDTAEQMKYGSRYLWDLAEQWEFKGKRINNLLCVAGLHNGLDDHLVDYWSAALSDCPIRYVNKSHASTTLGPTIYACDDGVADSVYLLVRNYLLHDNILNQSVLGVSLNGRVNRGGAIYLKVKDANDKGTRYARNRFVRAIEPRPSVDWLAHYGTQEENNTDAGNANEVGVCEITSNIKSYKGLPEGSYRINFYDSEVMNAGETTSASTPSFTSELIPIKNDRVTVTYIRPTQNASDIVFLIDSTGSMSGQINSVKSHAKSILSETLAKSPQSRFAVVEYRDFPTSPYGSSGDFTHKVKCKFTSNQAAVISAINGISVGGGGDSDESLYSALVACADGGELGGWLNSNRSIITMTDAAPHDPEPYTGHTRSSVTSILNSGGLASGGATSGNASSSGSKGGISLYTTLSSSSSSLKSFYSGLCGDTGGTAAFASSSSEVGEMVHDLIQASTASVDADWFVNASSGNDENSGLSWATAKKSINALDGLLQSNDVVAVASGVYAPIILTNDVPVTFKNINDANTVIVDGGGTNRCVNVPSRLFFFEGFVFRNGFAEGFGGGVVGGSYESCVFSNNQVVEVCQSEGEAVAGMGGAAYDALLKECTVLGNYAVGFGGGLYGCTAVDCVVSGNNANVITNESGVATGGGGGIAYSIAERCSIGGNVSDGRGGGAYSSTLCNSLLTNNLALVAGGAAEISSITNCTIVCNTSELGAGVSGSEVVNSIIWDNRTYSDILANYDGSVITYSCTSPLVVGSGNISSDPLFIDTSKFLLPSDSPCVDAGATECESGESDFKHEVRVYNSVVDMGANEYCAAPPAPTNFTASSGTYFSGIHLAWDDALAASTYSIWRSTTPEISSAEEVASCKESPYLDKDVDEGDVYYYWVKASNSGGSSEFSAMASGARAYFPPEGLNVAVGPQAESIVVSWSDMSNAWYRVYRADSETNDFIAVSEWQSDTSYADTLIEANKFYYYAVSSAINSSGDGASSLSVVERGQIEQVAPPVFAPVTRTVFFGSRQPVVISCATPEAEIRYTLDGAEPTESSPLYDGSLVISNNVTVKARAFAEYMRPSEIVHAEYIHAAIVGGNLAQSDTLSVGVPQTLNIPAPGAYKASFDYSQGGDVELRLVGNGRTNTLAVISATSAGSTNFLFEVAEAGKYELSIYDLSLGVAQPATMSGLNICIPDTERNRSRYWIYETEDTFGSTGEWIAEYGFVNGKMPVNGSSVFTAARQSSGRNVTILTTVEFDPLVHREAFFAELEGLEPVKAAIHFGRREDGVPSFQVLSIENGQKVLLNVSGVGLSEPIPGTPYTIKLALDCTNRTYEVALVERGGHETPLTHGTTNCFPFVENTDLATCQVEYRGRGNVLSLHSKDDYPETSFMQGDALSFEGSQMPAITEGEAAWLNSMNSYDVVKSKVASMSRQDIEEAYLLNLDITQDVFGLDVFKVSGVEVAENEVRIHVWLNRIGVIQMDNGGGTRNAPINGMLKLYGGDTPQTKDLLNATIMTDANFSEGNTATITSPRNGDARFFRPVIEAQAD